MRDALILVYATVIPPSATSSRRRRRLTTVETRSKPNLKHKPQFSTHSPLTSSSPRDQCRSLTYNSDLASTLAEDGRLEDLLTNLEVAAASGMKPSELLALLKAKNVASEVAGVLGEGQRSSVVEMLFNGVRELGIEPVQLFDGAAMESLRGECRRLLECGEVEQLVSLIEKLAGFQFRIMELVVPSDVINHCINKKNPTAAIRFAQNSPHAEMLFCSIISEFGKKRDMASALTAFEASKQNLSSPNMHVYRTIIDVCGLCGDYLKSRAIYEELLAGNFTPNNYVFNSLMNVNAHDLSYTLNIYKKMEKLGVKADITSHNIVLKSCCRAANAKLAQDIYRQIRKLESEGALKLDVFTYSTMIKVLADANKWKLALEIKEDMVSSGVIPNTITWSSLISACANAGLTEQAIQLFDEMLQAGAQPNSQCFNVLLHACVKSCQFDRAFRLFQCWKEKSFQQTITDDVMNNSNQMRVPSRPYSHMTMKLPFRPTTTTYNILMKACGTDYFRAKSLMDEMKTLGLSPDQRSWTILIDICGGSGNVVGAIQIMRSMRESGIQPDVITYTAAIKICVEHKEPKVAFMLFAEMQKYQIKPNLVTYNTILRARSQYGSLQEVQQCLAVYQHMRRAGYKPNDYYLKQLVEEWCECVIQNEHKNKSQFATRLRDFEPQSLLLEKVAEHLQGSAKSLSIDLRGLTKVEARIVVLAALGMIKEKFIAGNSIKDDVSIVLGQEELGAHVAKDENGVREAVIQLLQHDLGLQVFAASFRTGNDVSGDIGDPAHSSLNLETSIRRPVVLQRLKVTRESLHCWLRRRRRSSTR